jgi:hypothetical protein
MFLLFFDLSGTAIFDGRLATVFLCRRMSDDDVGINDRVIRWVM